MHILVARGAFFEVKKEIRGKFVSPGIPRLKSWIIENPDATSVAIDRNGNFRTGG